MHRASGRLLCNENSVSKINGSMADNYHNENGWTWLNKRAQDNG